MGKRLFRLIPAILLFSLSLSLALDSFSSIHYIDSFHQAQLSQKEKLGDLRWAHSAFFDLEEVNDEHSGGFGYQIIPNTIVIPSSQVANWCRSHFNVESPPFYLLYSAWRSYLLP